LQASIEYSSFEDDQKSKKQAKTKRGRLGNEDGWMDGWIPRAHMIPIDGICAWFLFLFFFFLQLHFAFSFSRLLVLLLLLLRSNG